MQTSPLSFHRRIAHALADFEMHRALATARHKFTSARRAAVSHYNERGDFEALRAEGKATRDDAIARMPELLETFSARAEAHGSHVLWAADAARACEFIVHIARQHNATTAIKSKSMVSEEIFLNDALTAAGIAPVETDLGEFILQLQDEKPVHLVAPAMHKTRASVARLFAEKLPGVRVPANADIPTLTRLAREHLRQQWLQADIGISGANFLAADSGAAVIVTNEGNGGMVTTFPRIHITLASIDKVVPSLQHIPALLALLTRSATGQHITNYIDLTAGNRRATAKEDDAAPAHHYIVLLDNGRSRLRASNYREMLRCIRCGACMNHCPVYHTIGGHAYGSVYMGPMGQVLTPALVGLDKAADLPAAATLCGACEVVCPVKIPLPNLMRRLRQDAVRQRITRRRDRWLMRAWVFCASRPAVYAFATRWVVRVLRLLSKRDANGERRVRSLAPFAAWTGGRDMVVPPVAKTFRDLWREKQRAKNKK